MIHDALKVLCEPGHVYEVRAFDVPQGSYQSKESGYFDDLNAMAEACEQLTNRGARAVYFTPNPVHADLLARARNRIITARRGLLTSDEDIDHRRWLLVDIDPVRASGISSTYEEHESALALALAIRNKMLARGWPRPVFGDSGNGAHLMWRIDLENTSESTALVQQVLQKLSVLFGTASLSVDQTVHNSARIWKVPGTWARKGDATAERPHRQACVVDAPRWLEEVTREQLEAFAEPETKTKAQVSATGRGSFSVDDFISRNFPQASPEEYRGGRKWVLEVCPFNSEHDDRSAVVIERADGALGFRCHHNGCAGRGWRELRELLEPGSRAEQESVFSDAEIDAWLAGPEPDAKPWQHLLIRAAGKDGEPGPLKPVVANALIILRFDREWRDVLAFDELRLETITLKRPPWGEVETCSWEPQQPWTDGDDIRLASWMSLRYGVHFTQKLGPVVETIARLRSFHPIVDYLDSLTWDGEKRLDTWLTHYLGVEETDYTRLVGRLWLVSAVARVYLPGCKADYVLVLEGAQGAGKSSALRALAGDWFNDTPVELGSKDSFMAIRGRWICELAELDALNRSEAARAKAFFSSCVDSYRPPYGHRTVDQPRRCVFAGTTNDSQYLRDATGGRRFWPVTCGAIDLPTLRADRGQLWAESRAAFCAGERWFPAGDEHGLCAEQQEARFQVDAWEEIVSSWLSGRTSSATLDDVMRHALGIESSNMRRGDQIRVGLILKRLGWESRRKQVAGRWVRAYEPTCRVELGSNSDRQLGSSHFASKFH